MPEILTIARLDWLRWLRRPAFWLLLAGITFALAFLFLRLVEGFDAIHAANLAGATHLTVTQAIVQPFFQQGGLLLLLLPPLLTMRSIAGEKREHSWTLLQLSGLSPAKIVVGKMLGVTVLLTAVVLLMAIMPITLLPGTSLDMGHLLSAAWGVWLLLIGFAAAGVFFSALSEEPVSAAMLHFGLLLLLALFHFTSAMPGAHAPVLYALSPFGHFTAFTEARFSSAHLLYFLLFTATFLWLAMRQLKQQRYPATTWQTRVRRLLVLFIGLALVVAAGIVSNRFQLSADLSRNHINSLPPAATNLLQKLAGPLEIKAVVATAPALRRKIDKALMPYLAANKNISLDFFTPEAVALQTRQPLQQEGRLEFHYGGRSETIKTLGEADILRALQRLIEGREQWIVFLEGHGEKSLYDASPGGYSTLDRLLRQQGYHTQAINLLKLPAIPDNTTVLAIATATQTLLPGERAAVKKYLQRGGNLLLLRDPVATEGIDSLLQQIGITALPGTVIDANERLRKLLAIRHPAIIPVTDYAAHPATIGLQGKMLLPIASALQATDDSVWSHQILLRSNMDSWNEVSDLKGHVRFDGKAGETAGPLALAIAAERAHPAEQRAAAIGDSDFLDNEYIGFGDNAAFALRLFDWLADPSQSTDDSTPAAVGMTLDMNDTALLAIAIALLLLLPLLFLLIALWQWRKARRPHA